MALTSEGWCWQHLLHQSHSRARPLLCQPEGLAQEDERQPPASHHSLPWRPGQGLQTGERHLAAGRAGHGQHQAGGEDEDLQLGTQGVQGGLHVESK